MSFAGLVHAGNMVDPEIGQFLQTMKERVTEISTETLFFTLEINKLDDAKFAEKMEVEELSHFEPWLSEVRAFKEHQLSDELEAYLHEQSVAGRAAWVRLFDETMAGLRFPFQGEEKRLDSLKPLILWTGCKTKPSLNLKRNNPE